MRKNAVFFFRNYVSKSSLCYDFTLTNHHFGLGFVGPDYTWCNGQTDLASRWALLDRFLANSDWISTFYSFHNRYLARTNFDHAPLFLTAQIYSHQKTKIFRFDNLWLDYDECHPCILKAWNSNLISLSMHAFPYSIACTKKNIIWWKASGMGSIDIEIQNIEQEIKNVEISKSTSTMCKTSMNGER